MEVEQTKVDIVKSIAEILIKGQLGDIEIKSNSSNLLNKLSFLYLKIYF